MRCPSIEPCNKARCELDARHVADHVSQVDGIIITWK